jgi:hypothetical protein
MPGRWPTARHWNNRNRSRPAAMGTRLWTRLGFSSGGQFRAGVLPRHDEPANEETPINSGFVIPTASEARESDTLVSQPRSLRTCRDADPRAEGAKRTAARAVAMARMSDKAIGDAECVEHSETYGLRHETPDLASVTAIVSVS